MLATKNQNQINFHQTKIYQRDITYRAGDYTIKSSYVGELRCPIGY